MKQAIEIANLTRRFGAKAALNDISLRVPQGGVFGLVGENGAGKTTLIKHILGLLRADTGLVRVFGMDPVTNPVQVLSRIGYVSEHRDLPEWMRIDELLRYIQSFYPRWDMMYAEQLREQFALDPRAYVRHLSQGQRAKAGLLIAQAHRPDLLLLDEPSSGLDPVVRRDILEAIIRTSGDEGRTIFFSSHLLDEIERVSDVVAMMHRGRLAWCGPLDEIKQTHLRLTLKFGQPRSTPPSFPGVLSAAGSGNTWQVICNCSRAELYRASAQLGAEVTEENIPSLDEIFVARVAQESTV